MQVSKMFLLTVHVNGKHFNNRSLMHTTVQNDVSQYV